MYPGIYAAEAPDRIAAVMTGTGETLSYGELEQRSVQLAHVLTRRAYGQAMSSRC